MQSVQKVIYRHQSLPYIDVWLSSLALTDAPTNSIMKEFCLSRLVLLHILIWNSYADAKLLSFYKDMSIIYTIVCGFHV